MALRVPFLLMLSWACLHWSTVSAFHRKPRNFRSSLVPDEMLWKSTDRMAQWQGYEAEVHSVRTPDGYLLTLIRIPRRQNQSDRGLHRTPVLACHGLGGNSEMWTFNANKSIVFRLVDAGYDVWLGNYRGTFYGRKHVKLNPDMHEFWDYSFNEHGLIDDPTFMEYVLQTTGREKLFTIGHSMGSASQVVLMSERPEYFKERVLASALFAPPIFFNDPHLVLGIWELLYGPLKEALRSQVINDKMPLLNIFTMEFCFPNSSNKINGVCELFERILFGESRRPITPAMQQMLHAHFPGGGSIRECAHFGQSMLDGHFRKYNFGPKKNRLLYGSNLPPDYNLSAIVTPVYVFYGSTDNQVSVEDAKQFIDAVPTVQESYEVPYNHLSYIFSEDVEELVTNRIIKAFNKYL